MEIKSNRKNADRAACLRTPCREGCEAPGGAEGEQGYAGTGNREMEADMDYMKKLAGLVAAAVLLCSSVICLADGLTVKDLKVKNGAVSISTPYISGAKGGKTVDRMVNSVLFADTDKALRGVLTYDENDAFDKLPVAKGGPSDQEYTKALVKYTRDRLDRRAEESRSAASVWYIRTTYEVASATDTFLSVVKKTVSYTGGAHDNVYWTTYNFDLENGKQLVLSDMFEKDAPYQGRLDTIIGWQEAGYVRAYRFINGRDPVAARPVHIRGDELFFVDPQGNLMIAFNPGDIAPYAGGVKVYSISVNDFADLMRLQK